MNESIFSPSIAPMIDDRIVVIVIALLAASWLGYLWYRLQKARYQCSALALAVPATVAAGHAMTGITASSGEYMWSPQAWLLAICLVWGMLGCGFLINPLAVQISEYKEHLHRTWRDELQD